MFFYGASFGASLLFHDNTDSAGDAYGVGLQTTLSIINLFMIFIQNILNAPLPQLLDLGIWKFEKNSFYKYVLNPKKTIIGVSWLVQK